MLKTKYQFVKFLFVALISAACWVMIWNAFSNKIIGGQLSDICGISEDTTAPIQSLSDLVQQIEGIRRACGDICDTTRNGFKGIFFNFINASVNCQSLFQNPYIDYTNHPTNDFESIPSELYKDFTMNYSLPVKYKFYNQRYLGKRARTPTWSKELIEDMKLLAKNGTLGGNYGIKETNALRDGLLHAPGVQNGRILVIGSENPWVEACVLEAGAREVITLEYGCIHSEHPQVKTIVPSEFRKYYLDNSLGLFDAVVTFSSVEHSGLGRYGDMLNPWGDIITVARGWCVTRFGGSLTIGVGYDYDNDHINFNGGRYYGKLRYPYLTSNWQQHYLGHGAQRVHVFVK